MTVPRLAALSKYWRDYPPVHIMVAAYLGIGKTEKKEVDDDGNSLFDLFPMSG